MSLFLLVILRGEDHLCHMIDICRSRTFVIAAVNEKESGQGLVFFINKVTACL